MRSFVKTRFHLLLGRIAATASDSGLLLHTEFGLLVDLSVCLLVMFVSPAKTAKPIEIPFAG